MTSDPVSDNALRLWWQFFADPPRELRFGEPVSPVVMTEAGRAALADLLRIRAVRRVAAAPDPERYVANAVCLRAAVHARLGRTVREIWRDSGFRVFVRVE